MSNLNNGEWDWQQGTPCFDPSTLAQVQQFYYREARLLDERCYQQWLSLLSEQIRYVVPNREVAALDPSQRETEALLAVERELSGEREPALRDENYLSLMIRATRAFKLNSWTDNPPARTRRLINNVEVFVIDGDRLCTFSNVMLSYSRHGHDNHLYTYQRRDQLQKDSDSYKIDRRTVILDWNVITGPSAGLLF